MMANHAGDIIVVHVVKALWQEFRERNWREFEEFEELKDQHFRHHPKSSMVVGPPSIQQHRVVTIGNPVATVMNDSMNSEKGLKEEKTLVHSIFALHMLGQENV
ncbi:hypothetical protein OESDEN_02541 [Oesophagostomum dentatum]|uniref:Uncharacterized protein n=1 Tax=Oesophagostomum dentatum TaxID=61180 RepID=A0A0B1TNR1_OESDE|nr:hypothetical protein OESDEN_02541 [Oesophagostomum dentatum]